MVAVELPHLSEAKLRHAEYPLSVARLIESAIDAYSKRELAQSLQAWNEAHDLVPQNPFIALGRGLTLLNLEQFQDALDDFTMAAELQVSPDFKVELLMARAIALHQLGRSREAISELDSSPSTSDPDLGHLRRTILDESLLRLVAKGFGAWSGKRPRGARNPVPISPGPPVSDFVIEDRG